MIDFVFNLIFSAGAAASGIYALATGDYKKHLFKYGAIAISTASCIVYTLFLAYCATAYTIGSLDKVVFSNYFNSWRSLSSVLFHFAIGRDIRALKYGDRRAIGG